MSKIREIIEKYTVELSVIGGILNAIDEDDFDKLEVDLLEEMRRFGNQRYESGCKHGKMFRDKK